MTNQELPRTEITDDFQRITILMEMVEESISAFYEIESTFMLSRAKKIAGDLRVRIEPAYRVVKLK